MEEQRVIDDFRSELHLLSGRLDLIDQYAKKEKKPWYKDASTIISVLAFVFSFSTTIASVERERRQDTHNLRVELRGILQRLTVLPAENIKTFQKYKDEPTIANALSGFLAQENSILSKQANEILRKLPADQISATDYIAVANSEQANRTFPAAIANLRLAVAAADGLDDEIGALRMLANIQMVTGLLAEGRNTYQNAMEIFSRRLGFDQGIQIYTNFLTELNWAGSEATIGYKDNAGQHLKDAQQILSSMLPGLNKNQWQAQLDYANKTLLGGNQVTLSKAASILQPNLKTTLLPVK